MDIQEYGNSIGTNIIQEYDPATDSWRLMEGMPFKRASMTGEKVGNYVYLIGGYLNSRDLDEPLSEVWRFNLRSLKPFIIYVTGVSLDTHSLEIEDGKTKTLKATVSPEGASDTSVIWSSADPSVATVADGVVTGVAKGQAYIYATTTDGNFIDSCLVDIVLVSINNAEATGFKLYPNPASDLITLEFNKQGTHMIKLTTLNGQLLYSDKIEGPYPPNRSLLLREGFILHHSKVQGFCEDGENFKVVTKKYKNNF